MKYPVILGRLFLRPNISGTAYSAYRLYPNNLTGAFSPGSSARVDAVDILEKATASQGWRFNASSSSSYYGATSKPQVDGVSSYILIKV